MSRNTSSGEKRSPVDDLLAHGTLLLESLSRAAAAARAEAKCAELELALAQAREGDALQLQRWLSENDPPTPSEQPESAEPVHRRDVWGQGGREQASAQPASSGESTGAPTLATPTKVVSSWDELVPTARRRLQARAEQLRGGADGHSHSLVSPADPSDQQRSSVASRGDRTTPLAQKAQAEAGPESIPKPVASEAGPPTGSTGAPGQKKTSSAAILPLSDPSAAGGLRQANRGNRAERPKSKRKLVELAKGFGDHQQDEQARKQHRLLVFSRTSGLLASFGAHVLLVAFLALMTLKMPTPPASLSLESTAYDEPEELLELTQPQEMTVPEEVAEPMPSAETSFELSESLTDVAPLPSDSLLERARLPSSASAALAASSAGSSSSRPIGAGASFFGASASGNCFCYVIDGSGSMRGGPWEAAKAELQKSLASLNENQRFTIIFFNRQLSVIPMPGEQEPAARALYATPENLAHARRWLDTLRIGIGASPIKALEFAISREPDAIYLLTDGVTQVDVAEFLRDRNRIADLINGQQVRVPIHPIAFYSLEGQALLQRIALENRGKFIYVADPRRK